MRSLVVGECSVEIDSELLDCFHEGLGGRIKMKARRGKMKRGREERTKNFRHPRDGRIHQASRDVYLKKVQNCF